MPWDLIIYTGLLSTSGGRRLDDGSSDGIRGLPTRGVKVMRGVKLVRLIRILKMIKLVQKLLPMFTPSSSTGFFMSKQTFYLLGRLIKFFLLLIILGHWTACLWRVVGDSDVSD